MLDAWPTCSDLALISPAAFNFFYKMTLGGRYDEKFCTTPFPRQGSLSPHNTTTTKSTAAFLHAQAPTPPWKLVKYKTY